MTLREIVNRLAFWGRRPTLDRQLSRELQSHIELLARDYEHEGMAPAEALAAARRRIGNVTNLREGSREYWGFPAIEQLVQDIRYAVRTVRRSPGFTMVIIALLGLGVGANTTIFTLFDAVAIRGLPVPHAGQLVAIGDPSLVNSTGEGSPHANLLSYPLYLDVRDHGTLFSGILASGTTGRLDALIGGPGAELEHPHGRFVSANYFSVLGVPAFRGRVFDGTEDRTIGGSPVAVISHAYWARRFHQAPSAMGQTIVVDNISMSIIGVAPPGFTGEVVGESADLWLPVSMADAMRPNKRVLERRNSSWLLLLARLTPGATLAQVRQDLTAFVPRTIVANAPGAAGRAFLARKPQLFVDRGDKGFSEVRQTFEAPLFTLMIGVALLLCIICANVANLLLARAMARGREMAVRLALGANRIRLVRQLFTESLLLASLGAATGLLLSWWGSRALLVLASDGSNIPLDLSLDIRVLAFTIGTSFAAVVLFGLAPALRSSRVDFASTLRANARTVAGGALGHRGGRTAIGNLLIAAQVGLSVVLLVGAAMLTRSLRNVESVDVGLDRDHLLIAEVDITARGYRTQRLAALTRQLRGRLAAIPGVAAVTYSENGIFSGTDWHTEIAIPGFTARAAGDSTISTDNAGPEYVRAIGGHLLAGRDIVDGDELRPDRIAVVNQSFAKFYFPGERAVGRHFRIEDSLDIQIVGVLADTRTQQLTSAPDRRAYFAYAPMDTVGSNPTALRFAIRTIGDPRMIAEQVRKAVVSVDPLLPMDGVNPLAMLMRQSIREERLVATIASAFGILAMLLASIGLYGVMTYAISRRTAEIGLRAALGAQRNDVLRLVLLEALRVVATGMAIGIPVALGSARFLRGQLHDVAAVDPVSIATAVLLLAVSATVATLLPAIRASSVSPLVALRAE